MLAHCQLRLIQAVEFPSVSRPYINTPTYIHTDTQTHPHTYTQRFITSPPPIPCISCSTLTQGIKQPFPI